MFGCYGETQTDLIYQAMLKAHDDGADIISLSIGASLPWSQYESYSSKIVSKLKEAGVTGKKKKKEKEILFLLLLFFF